MSNKPSWSPSIKSKFKELSLNLRRELGAFPGAQLRKDRRYNQSSQLQDLTAQLQPKIEILSLDLGVREPQKNPAQAQLTVV
tara:strand:- start:262 stop:507 length:246 start_codon:yes stop_codon:yes gene_type:complete